MHAHFDENMDGKVSVDEILNYSKRNAKDLARRGIRYVFDEMDLSKDGKLSLQEHLEDIRSNRVVEVGGEDEVGKETAQSETLEAKKFAAADSNGDGVLDEAELVSLLYPETHDGVLDLAVEETLVAEDVDGDGRLSAKEFWLNDDDPDSEDAEQSVVFARLDADGDGYLSQEELRVWVSGAFRLESSMNTLFEIADSDGDSHVTAEELLSVQETIAELDAHHHLVQWAEHHEL